MKENHRVESLKPLSQSARRKRIRRFESSARVYAYSFDNAASALLTTSANSCKNSLAFCRFFARMVVNSRRIRDFLRCYDLLGERVF
jgi:hypothetical protein